MGNDKQNDDARKQYNQAVDQMATGIYSVLPAAGFTATTLTKLATMRKQEVPWDKLPVDVKLCLIRLAMGMLPKPDDLAKAQADAAREEQKTPVERPIPPSSIGKPKPKPEPDAKRETRVIDLPVEAKE